MTSILPRLDEFQGRLAAYNNLMKEVCCRNDAYFFDATANFPTKDLKLWSWKDGVHISEDRGLPLLKALLAHHIQRALEPSQEVPVPLEPKRPTNYHAPMWRKLKTPTRLGMI